MGISKYESKILISSWLQCEHLDDVEQLTSGTFDNEYRMMFSAIKDGCLNAVDIAKRSNVPLAEMSDIISMYSPALYENVMLNILRDKMHHEIASNPQALPEDIAEIAQKYTRSWNRKRPQKANLIQEFINEMDERKNGSKMMTGIGPLDMQMHGIHKGQLTAIGARPGTGKSALMLQVALNVAKSGAKVLFFPLEMSATETMERVAMRFSDIASTQMKTGDLKDKDWDELQSDVFPVIERFGDNLSVYVGENIIEDIAWLIEEEQPDLVIIDQLSQLRSNRVEFYSVRERFAHMTSTLKHIALNKKVAIWLACQLNRESRLQGKAMIENLKEAGNIEEDSDNVILLSNRYDSDGNYELTANGHRRVTVEIAKQRQGAPGTWTMEFIAKRFLFQAESIGNKPDTTNDIPF